ncbi:Major facilitator superfamily [Corchorus olitorius]|uniref:Major facilitator superfamily n=1 Tax=Corchorus olitorius TaxID=93759 RepID=A0A1R3L3C5_9ROSI|nr:Major facilitator superfamily [Corchorus olitorius]
MFTLAYGLFEVPTGLLGDRLGAKRLLVRVVLWWSFFTVLTGFSTGFVMLLVVRFLFGIGEAGAYPNISIALSKWLPAFERGKGQALIWAASRIGAGLTPILVIPIQQQYGWQMSFYVLGGVGLLWKIDNSATTLPSNRWMPKYLQQGRGISEENMKFIASAPFILGAVGCFLGGILSDYTVKKYGKKWGRRIVPMIGLSLSGICLITASLSQNDTLAVVLLSLGLATMDVTAPVAWAVAMDIGGKQSGTVSGAMNSAGLIGAYINTVSFGYLATTFGYYFPVLMIGGLLLLGSVLWLKIDATLQVATHSE